MLFLEKEDDSLVFRENGETVMVTPWGSDSLRVRASFLGDIADDSAALLPQAEVQNATIRIAPDGMSGEITNGKVTAKMSVRAWGNALQITFVDHTGRVLLQEVQGGGALSLRARYYRALSGGDFYLRASFVSNPEEKIYGMGQYQQERMNLKGCNLELAHRNSQASIPFYVSSLGYGFLWNNAAIGEVHFGLNTTEWTSECARQFDYWITAGDTPAEIEHHYALATGTVPMMPEYGLGFWQCKLRYYSQEQVLEVAREYHRRRIPVDVLVIDYYHWPKCGDWRFDSRFFPDPKAMVEELHALGIETMVSVWPQVDTESENYEEMRRKGLLVRSNSGVDVQMSFHGNNVFMDATNPKTRAYVWEKCRENYAAYGIRTFWLDEAEPEFTGYDYENYRYHAGPVLKVGNIYPREYARTFYEGQKAAGQKDIVNLIRCAWAGSQRYGALVWSGDIMSTYEDFRKQICAGIHMGLCGIPWWTTDIGGFHGGQPSDPDFRELLVRWFEFGTFCPVMRIHGCRQPYEAVDYGDLGDHEGTGAPNEVWSYGEEICSIMTKYIRLREKMRDYTRQLMKEAHETGDPLIRALFYEFPQDQVCWEITDEYCYGPDLLIAPVCHAKEQSRSVYLPSGADWTSALDGRQYEGGRSYEIEAPVERVPVFTRNGRQSWIVGMI